MAIISKKKCAPRAQKLTKTRALARVFPKIQKFEKTRALARVQPGFFPILKRDPLPTKPGLSPPPIGSDLLDINIGKVDLLDINTEKVANWESSFGL